MKVTSLALLILPACTAGFFFNNNLLRPPVKVSSDEERAAAMSQYLAKAHEEKLRAVKAAEDKKQEEIRRLKEEIAALKAINNKSPVISASPPPPGPLGDLAKYQEFIKTYIVNAHQQKVDAIKAAEAALNKRWEEKMAEFGFAGPSRTVAPSGDIMLKPKVVDVILAARNEGIKASASAGKSRWGESEVHKVKAGAEMGSFVKSSDPATLSAPPRGPAIPFSSGDAIPQTPEIVAADHGLRADGGVGGPTLAERVVLGPNVGAQVAAAPRASGLTLEERLAGAVNIGARIVRGISTSAAAPVSAAVQHESSFYQMRNSKVLQEAGAGKSRWGSKEIERVRSLPVSKTPVSGKSTVPVPPEVEAADHGLRADGGVGGPTLAERIAFGANIGAQIVAQTTASSSDLYEKRNAHVAAAAAAGKSRWGSQEVAKVSHTKKIDSVEIVNSHHPEEEDMFELRNHKVLAESAAGKSRWGKEEVSRLQMHSGSSKGFPARVNGSAVGV